MKKLMIKLCPLATLKPHAVQYSSLSNYHAGYHKHAGWKKRLIFGNFKNQKVFKTLLRFLI